MCLNKDKNGRKDFEKLNFEVESDQWFDTFLVLTI